MSKNIVFEGWLTKSPPTNRIFRTKWRKRWFALRQSGELPGQYFLDYYADRNRRRLKGTINLDLCEQVDAGLHMERTGTASLDPKLRGSVFTIQTQQRTYHLEAECEADMEKWVDVICKVCGLRATGDSPSVLETYQNGLSSMSAMNDQYGCDSTGPYIPISECITGVRAQAFTFDPKTIVMNNRALDRVSDRSHQMYMSQPHIRLNNTELFDNDSNLSDEECKSLNASQSNIRDWTMAKSINKLAISPKRNGFSGPPTPPPRPPKTFLRETYQGPKIQEPRPTDNKNTDGLQYLDLDLHTSKPPTSKQQDPPVVKNKGIVHGKSLSAAEAEVDSAYKTVDFLKTEAFNITRQDAEASRSNQY